MLLSKLFVNIWLGNETIDICIIFSVIVKGPTNKKISLIIIFDKVRKIKIKLTDIQTDWRDRLKDRWTDRRTNRQTDERQTYKEKNRVIDGPIVFRQSSSYLFRGGGLWEIVLSKNALIWKIVVFYAFFSPH